MMQAMRDRVKVIYWIVILTFVGLMFLVWGVGLDGGGGPTVTTSVVARVDGREITQERWVDRTNSILASMRQQQPNNQNLSENQVLRAREQAYNSLVEETLQQMQAEEFGITVTDEEIVQILSEDPPPYIRSQFTDAQGNFDAQQYYAALQNPTIPWDLVEADLRYRVPLEKLQQMIAGRAVVGEAEIRARFAEQNERAVAEYIGVPFSTITLDDETVTDDQARAYYDAHLHEFQRPAQATVKVAQLTKEANEEDEAEVLSILSEIRAEIEGGTINFADAARTYSEDTSAETGGDLGFLDRDRMVAPFTEAAFALGVGQLSEPVRTEFGVHLIQVTDEKLDEDGNRTEVQASHILLKLHPSQDTIDSLRDRFYDFHEEALVMGLTQAAEQHSLEVAEPGAFQEGFNVPGIPNSLPGSGFAFSHQPGELSPVFETNEMLYTVEVVQRDPAGHRPLEEVRSIVDAAVVRERRADRAAAQLAEAWREVQGGASMEQVAADNDLAHAVTDTFTLRENIPDIGFATSFARAALELDVGDSLPSVRTNRGVYALRVLWKSGFDEDEYRARRAQIAATLLYSQQQKLVREWLDGLKDDAEVEDLRSDLL